MSHDSLFLIVFAVVVPFRYLISVVAVVIPIYSNSYFFFPWSVNILGGVNFPAVAQIRSSAAQKATAAASLCLSTFATRSRKSTAPPPPLALPSAPRCHVSSPGPLCSSTRGLRESEGSSRDLLPVGQVLQRFTIRSAESDVRKGGHAYAISFTAQSSAATVLERSSPKHSYKSGSRSADPSFSLATVQHGGRIDRSCLQGDSA